MAEIMVGDVAPVSRQSGASSDPSTFLHLASVGPDGGPPIATVACVVCGEPVTAEDQPRWCLPNGATAHDACGRCAAVSPSGLECDLMNGHDGDHECSDWDGAYVGRWPQ